MLKGWNGDPFQDCPLCLLVHFEKDTIFLLYILAVIINMCLCSVNAPILARFLFCFLLNP